MTRALARRRLSAGKVPTFQELRVMFRETDKKFQKSEQEFQESKRKSEQEWEESKRKSEQEFQESKRKSEQEFQESKRKSEQEWEESKRKSEQEWKEIREQSKETDKKFQETDKKFQETDKKFQETDKKFQETDKKFGELGLRFGEVVEHLVAAGIEEKFNELGYHFSEVAPEGHKILDDNGQKKAQIDILLENGETVMAVEVKSKPNNKDIKEHIERLQILRESRSRKNDKRKIEGAIAGAIFKDNVKTAAQDAGLFVIVQAGDTMKIEAPEGWKPKAW
jgi:hypothetical protein